MESKQLTSGEVFVIVVTFNGARWIRKCLGSVTARIIVVDNGSTDETISIIRNEFPMVDLIVNRENMGFGQANNIGIRKALKEGAAYVFLLNQDAWFEEDTTLRELIRIHRENRDYGILSPVHMTADGQNIDSNFLFYLYKTERILSDIYTRNLKSVYPTDFANAAAWLIPASCFRTVGLFDPIFFHYSEDRDFCVRVMYHGLKIGICPGTKIIHDRANRGVPDTREKIRQQTIRESVVSLIDIRQDNFTERYNVLVGTIKRKIYKGLLTFDMKKVKEGYGELNYFKDRRKGMVESIQRNKIGGPAYFDLPPDKGMPA